MPKSLKTRLSEQGISDVIVKSKILENGLLDVSDEIGCSLETITKYAKQDLGIQNPSLVTQRNIQPIDRIATELCISIFDYVEQLRKENAKLREENSKLIRGKQIEEIEVKNRLLEFISAIRVQRELSCGNS